MNSRVAGTVNPPPRQGRKIVAHGETGNEEIAVRVWQNATLFALLRGVHTFSAFNQLIPKVKEKYLICLHFPILGCDNGSMNRINLSADQPPNAGQPAKSERLPPVASLRLSPLFKLLFLSVLGLTVLSLIVSVYLVTRDNPSEEVMRLAETCSTTWKLGSGAVVGLIGGKVSDSATSRSHRRK